MDLKEFNENRRTLEVMVNHYQTKLDMSKNLLKKLRTDFWVDCANDKWSNCIGQDVKLHSTNWRGEEIVSEPEKLIRFDWTDEANIPNVYPLTENSKPIGGGQSRFAVEYITDIEIVFPF